MTFSGWTRLPGQTWQAVVTGADEDTAWRLLRQHVEHLDAKLIDLYVGPAGAVRVAAGSRNLIPASLFP